MQIYPHPGGPQPFEHLSMAELDSVELQTHHVQMPRRFSVCLCTGQCQRQVRQQPVITHRQLTPTRDERIKLAQLRQPQGSLQIGDAIVETQLHLLVVPGAVAGLGHLRRIPGHTVATQALQALSEFRVVGQDHPAFGAGDDLHRMETEHRHRRKLTATYRTTGIGRSDRVGRIFDDRKAITLGQFGDAAHVAALPGERHGHQHFGQRTVLLGLIEFHFEGEGIEVPGQRIDVHEVDVGAAVTAAVGRGQKGVGRGP